MNDPTEDPRASGYGAYCETWSGKVVDATHLRPEDVDIQDIAHHLAATNRYNGATCRVISVAEHSWRVKNFLRDHLGAGVLMLLAGQLHDAAEYLTGDFIGPLKYAAGVGDALRELEDRMMKVIAPTLGFAWPKPSLVDKADKMVMWLEADAIMPSRGRTWKGWKAHGEPVVAEFGSLYREMIQDVRFDRNTAAAIFLRHYDELQGLRGRVAAA